MSVKNKYLLLWKKGPWACVHISCIDLSKHKNIEQTPVHDDPALHLLAAGVDDDSVSVQGYGHDGEG